MCECAGCTESDCFAKRVSVSAYAFRKMHHTFPNGQRRCVRVAFSCTPCVRALRMSNKLKLTHFVGVHSDLSAAMSEMLFLKRSEREHAMLLCEYNLLCCMNGCARECAVHMHAVFPYPAIAHMCVYACFACQWTIKRKRNNNKKTQKLMIANVERMMCIGWCRGAS